MLETLLILVLAPAFTSGAISLEREKQTLELLVTTPLSSLAVILGKLLSALVYVFLLIVASIPFASLVFAFGGVGPEDLVRAYLFLFALAFGMGSVGLFVSALVRRTQVATVLTYVTVLALTLGTAAVYVFWTSVSAPVNAFGVPDRARAGAPPEALVWLNPFVANADLICGTSSSGYDAGCGVIAQVTGKPYFGAGLGASPGAFRTGEGFDVRCTEEGCMERPADVRAPIADPLTAGFPRDTFWPRSGLAFVVTGLVLTLLSTQLVSPTRRLRLPRFHRRPTGTRVPAPPGSSGSPPPAPPPPARGSDAAA